MVGYGAEDLKGEDGSQTPMALDLQGFPVTLLV